MSFTPLRDFILVSKDATEERVAGSLLYRPATAEDKIVRGTVIAVGSGWITTDGTVVPLEVKVGDKVLFNRTYSVEVSSGSETMLVLKEEHLMCVVKD